MIIGIGVDISKVSRFEKWVKDEKMIPRFFNAAEINNCRSIQSACKQHPFHLLPQYPALCIFQSSAEIHHSLHTLIFIYIKIQVLVTTLKNTYNIIFWRKLFPKLHDSNILLFYIVNLNKLTALT